MIKSQPSATTIPIDSAFQKLFQQADDPYVACEQFNKALREGRIHLWADETEVKPSFFVSHLLVVVDEAHGSWKAALAMLRAVEQPREWTVSAKDINDLVKSKAESPRRRPGPVNTHDWIAISAEIAFRCRSKVPENERKFAGEIMQWCEDTYDNCPAESAVRGAVKQVCGRFRKG
jgi:hypothetical protein